VRSSILDLRNVLLAGSGPTVLLFRFALMLAFLGDRETRRNRKPHQLSDTYQMALRLVFRPLPVRSVEVPQTDHIFLPHSPTSFKVEDVELHITAVFHAKCGAIYTEL